jgi:hypothetical protein
VRVSDNGPRPPARYGQNDRAIAIGRKNYLFAGPDAGGRRAAPIYSLIESAKLNGLNPQHYLADVLTRIADHPARRIAELLPWKGNRPTLPAPPPEPAHSPSAYLRHAAHHNEAQT